MRFSELQEKEVINVCDCKKIGYVSDLMLSDDNSSVEAFVVPKAGRLCSIFGDGSNYIIPYKCIRKIGRDIILVEVRDEKESLHR